MTPYELWQLERFGDILPEYPHLYADEEHGDENIINLNLNNNETSN